MKSDICHRPIDLRGVETPISLLEPTSPPMTSFFHVPKIWRGFNPSSSKATVEFHSGDCRTFSRKITRPSHNHGNCFELRQESNTKNQQKGHRIANLRSNHGIKAELKERQTWKAIDESSLVFKETQILQDDTRFPRRRAPTQKHFETFRSCEPHSFGTIEATGAPRQKLATSHIRESQFFDGFYSVFDRESRLVGRFAQGPC